MFQKQRSALGSLLNLSLSGGLLSLTACHAPVQDFPVGSALWHRSNPEFVASDQARFAVPKRVQVAVLDGGVDYNHPRLRGHLMPFEAPASSGRSYGIGFDLLGGPADFFPHFSILSPDSEKDLADLYQAREHGTHVSGLATLGNPEIGLLPVRVLPVPEKPGPRVEPEELLLNPAIKTGYYVDAVAHVGKGVALACRHGAQVLNLSLGIDLTELDASQQQVVRSSMEEGILRSIRQECERALLVVAAGNESREIKDFTFSIPVTLEEPNILGVGALKDRQRTAYYSNQGRFVDVFMRGSDVRSAVPPTDAEPDGLTALLSGTSMATPLVSHLAARILLAAPELSARQVRALILNTASLEELELEPSPSKSEEAPLPARRLGLVAQFRVALKAARELHERREDSSPEAQALRSRLLTAPFEHGHSPF